MRLLTIGAKWVAGGLVVGQLIAEETDINWIIFVIGAFATLGLYTSSVKLHKDYDRTRRLSRIPGVMGLVIAFRSKSTKDQPQNPK